MYRVILSLALIFCLLVGVADAKKHKHKKKKKAKPAAEAKMGKPTVDATKVKSTTATSATSAEDQFKALDKNSDSKLSLQEYAAGKDAKGQEIAANIFKAADKDQDNALTLDEFKTTLPKMPVKTNATTAEDQFKALDKNSDGKLSLQEYAAGRDAKGQEIAASILKAADKDHDKALTLDEFKTTLPKGAVKNSAASAEDQFKALDKNSDGKLSLQEYAAGKKDAKGRETSANIFKAADKDQDKALTLDEFKTTLRKVPVKNKAGKKAGDIVPQ